MSTNGNQLPSKRYIIGSLSVITACVILLLSGNNKVFFGDSIKPSLTFEQNIMSSKNLNRRLMRVLPMPQKLDKLAGHVFKSLNDSRQAVTDSDSLCPNCTNISNIGGLTKILSSKPIVLVIAYYRSGSTFTGQLLQENPNTFYVFEPIRLTGQRFAQYANSRARNVNISYITGYRLYQKDQITQVIEDEIKAWLTCDLSAISIQSLTDNHLRFSEAFKNFSTCSGLPYFNHPDRCMTLNTTHKQRIHECLQPIIDRCKQSSTIVLKFIRETVKATSRLLHVFPAMKVIHLIRDPRGMVRSQQMVDGHAGIGPDSTSNLCNLIFNNLKATKEVMKDFPERIRLQRYEDLAEFPLVTAESIYKFVGFNFTRKAVDFLKLNTKGGFDNDVWSITRKNSKRTASAWRYKLDYSVGQLTYEFCNKSMTILGYLPFATAKDMVNTTVPSRLMNNATEKLLKT